MSLPEKQKSKGVCVENDFYSQPKTSWLHWLEAEKSNLSLKKEKGSFYSTKILSNNTFDLLWKILYTGTQKRVTLRNYQVLYTCCEPMSLICTRMVITDDPVLKLNYLMTETNPGPPLNNIDPTLTVKTPFS